MSLVETSLAYSHDKRAEQHQAALELALELERIGRQLRREHLAGIARSHGHA